MNPSLGLSLEVDFWILSFGSWIRGTIANSLWDVSWLHHASLHGIIMDISFLHLSFIIFMHCICINHCIIIHLHLACFCSVNCIHSIFIICMHNHDTKLLMPCIFQKKNQTKKQKKKKKKCLIDYVSIKKK